MSKGKDLSEKCGPEASPQIEKCGPLRQMTMANCLPLESIITKKAQTIIRDLKSRNSSASGLCFSNGHPACLHQPHETSVHQTSLKPTHPSFGKASTYQQLHQQISTAPPKPPKAMAMYACLRKRPQDAAYQLDILVSSWRLQGIQANIALFQLLVCLY